MTSRTLIFPAFDTLELTEAPEADFTRPEILSPVQSGATVAGLRTAHHRGRWHPFFDEIVFNDNAHALSYTHKPLLLYFYEHDWGAASQAHLRQLDTIQRELRYRQTNLLIVTAKSLQQFREEARTGGLALDIFEDRDNELAGLLRLYADQSPSWSRYPGIEHNVALPGVYLLDQKRQVAFAYPNEEISQELPVRQLLEATTRDDDHPPRKSA